MLFVGAGEVEGDGGIVGTLGAGKYVFAVWTVLINCIKYVVKREHNLHIYIEESLFSLTLTLPQASIYTNEFFYVAFSTFV